MERENVGQYIRRIARQSGMGGRLIAASTIVFLLFLGLDLAEFMFDLNGFAFKVKSFFVAPGNLEELLYKPWTIITHMFTHGSFRHYVFNMIILYFSSRIFVHFFSERRLLSTYFVGGIAAYLVYVIVHMIFPTTAIVEGVELVVPTDSLVGASGAIMAIFVASAVHKPGFKVNLFGVFPVSLFILAALYVISDLVSIGDDDRVAHFAHLGGAAFGALSVINAHSSKNIMNRIDRLIFKLKLGDFSFKRKKKSKMKVYLGTETSRMTDEEYNSKKAANQDRVNAILDKISKKGYEGLTKEEKDILFNESKRK